MASIIYCFDYFFSDIIQAKAMIATATTPASPIVLIRARGSIIIGPFKTVSMLCILQDWPGKASGMCRNISECFYEGIGGAYGAVGAVCC